MQQQWNPVLTTILSDNRCTQFSQFTTIGLLVDIWFGSLAVEIE
jgi:hypothetical protein